MTRRTAFLASTAIVAATWFTPVYDGIRNFVRHPTEPTTGHAQLVWHYANSTWLYPLFETKINKPLTKPFASNVSFYWKDYQWKFDVTIRKAEVE